MKTIYIWRQLENGVLKQTACYLVAIDWVAIHYWYFYHYLEIVAIIITEWYLEIQLIGS